jgi:hypothetical protein
VSVAEDQAIGTGDPVVRRWRGTERRPAGHPPVDWTVTVVRDIHGLIHRTVKPDSRWTDRRETVWPVWFPRLDQPQQKPETPLSGALDHWSALGDRLRDSAKWMSAIVGAALGLLLGTSPLAKVQPGSLHRLGMTVGGVGLALLCTTLLLILRVMRPSAVSFLQIESADKPGHPLSQWKEVVEEQHDIYLPGDVEKLSQLRDAMIVEELTLAAMEELVQHAVRDGAEREVRADLELALRARSEWLGELKRAAGEITAIGEFYRLRHRSSVATYAGVPCAAAGMCGVIYALITLHT